LIDHRNHASILYHFRDIVSYLLKIKVVEFLATFLVWEKWSPCMGYRAVLFAWSCV